MGTGVVTAVPLVLFSYGANLLPLNVLGFFQYISPTIGLLLGIFFFHETFGMAQISALGFVWAAIVLFTVRRACVEDEPASKGRRPERPLSNASRSRLKLRL